MSATSEPEFIPIGGVVSLTTLSETKLRQMIRDRAFPAPVKLNRAARWSRAAVLRWIEEQTTATVTREGMGPVVNRAGREVQVRG